MNGTDCLGLPGWTTMSAEVTDGGDIKVVAEPDPRAMCLECGSKDDLVRFGTRKRLIHDVPHGDQRVGIQVAHPCYKCKACGALTYDRLLHVNEKRAMTDRLVEHIINRVLDDRFTHVAGTTGMHEKTIRNVFTDWRLEQERKFHVKVPRVLGLDVDDRATLARGDLVQPAPPAQRGV